MTRPPLPTRGQENWDGALNPVLNDLRTSADASDAALAGRLSESSLNATIVATGSQSFGAVHRERFGSIGLQRRFLRMGGRTAAFASVTTNLTQGVEAQIPLAELIDCTYFYPSSNAIVVPAGARPMRVTIKAGVKFAGSTAGDRELRIKRNGSVQRVEQGYGDALTLSIEYDTTLFAGDQITLFAYSASTGSSVTATGGYDVWLEVAAQPVPAIEHALTGWSWGPEIAGLEGRREIQGGWLSCTSWANLSAPLGTGTYFDTWVAANPDGAVDVAGPLIPHFASGVNYTTEMNNVLAGQHDADYAAFGAALAQHTPQTVFLRPWWEFNISTEQPNQALFIQTWNYAVPLIRAAFASAARPGQTLQIVWCFGGESADPTPWFPATANVDVVSVDTYIKKYGTATPTEAAVYGSNLTDLAMACKVAAQYGKPVAISEWANWAVHTEGTNQSYGLGDYPNGIDYMFDFFERAGVIYSIYFNNGGTGSGGLNQTMADTPNSRARFISHFNRSVLV